MILIDSNVLMYAGGAEHPNKARSLALLRKVADSSLAAVLDAEVLQEIIHRYRALNRWEDGRRLYELARSLFSEDLPVAGEVMDQAKELVTAIAHLSVRDAVHAAVVLVNSLEGICSSDSDFDRIPDIARIAP